MDQIGSFVRPSNRKRLSSPVVLALVALAIALLPVGCKRAPAKIDSAYLPHVQLSHFAMSESANLAGGKVTYLDGQLTNTGSKTLLGVTVRILFRNPAGQITQNTSMPLDLIRTRQPYIDTEPIAASPLQPGQTRDFRLIFDQITPDWDGQYPQVTVIGAQTR